MTEGMACQKKRKKKDKGDKLLKFVHQLLETSQVFGNAW